jgi:hypothetical protein
VHQTDAMDGSRWDGGGDPWNVSPWNKDRFACSLINAHVPHMFSTSAVGFVLRPSALAGVVACSYPRDGNSMNNGPHGCGPDSYKHVQIMLRVHQNHLKPNENCLWGKPDAIDRSGCRYNEVVLNGSKYAERLPNAIEAIFLPTHQNGFVHHSEGDANAAHRLRAAFLQTYGLHAEDIPLLSFDMTEARRGHAPFRPLSL